MKGNEHRLKEVVDKLLDIYRIRQKYHETAITAHWEEIMGKMIANRTTKVYIKDKKLYLKLDSAVLRSELSMAKHKIIELLNKRSGAAVIQDVVFL